MFFKAAKAFSGRGSRGLAGAWLPPPWRFSLGPRPLLAPITLQVRAERMRLIALATLITLVFAGLSVLFLIALAL